MPFSIIVLSPETNDPSEIESVVKLFKNGLRLFHLRKPKAGKKELKLYLKGIPNKYYKRIVLHSHYELANEYKLKGIHLGETTKKDTSILEKEFRIVSASFHSIEQLEKNTGKYEYVFLSPVFDSISKKEYQSTIDKKQANRFLNANKKEKVIALGGISIKNILKVREMGFACGALLGAIWLSKNPVKNFLKIRSVIE